MVAIMLDAISSLLSADFDFDFLINLSDADLALRTDAEVSARSHLLLFHSGSIVPGFCGLRKHVTVSDKFSRSRIGSCAGCIFFAHFLPASWVLVINARRSRLVGCSMLALLAV
eukprot:6173061-Pleurochrysis_carterae.AAC.1